MSMTGAKCLQVRRRQASVLYGTSQQKKHIFSAHPFLYSQRNHYLQISFLNCIANATRSPMSIGGRAIRQAVGVPSKDRPFGVIQCS